MVTVRSDGARFPAEIFQLEFRMMDEVHKPSDSKILCFTTMSTPIRGLGVLGVKRPGHEADYSPLYLAKRLIAWHLPPSNVYFVHLDAIWNVQRCHLIRRAVTKYFTRVVLSDSVELRNNSGVAIPISA
jgi:hypothetical protein